LVFLILTLQDQSDGLAVRLVVDILIRRFRTGLGQLWTHKLSGHAFDGQLAV
jgi:hypothetical protein